MDFGAEYLGYECEDVGFRVFACLDGLPAGGDGVCVEVCADDGALKKIDPQVVDVVAAQLKKSGSNVGLVFCREGLTGRHGYDGLGGSETGTRWTASLSSYLMKATWNPLPREPTLSVFSMISISMLSN